MSDEAFHAGLEALLREHSERPALEIAEDLLGYGIGVAIQVAGQAEVASVLTSYAIQLLAEAETAADPTSNAVQALADAEAVAAHHERRSPSPPSTH